MIYYFFYNRSKSRDFLLTTLANDSENEININNGG